MTYSPSTGGRRAFMSCFHIFGSDNIRYLLKAKNLLFKAVVSVLRYELQHRYSKLASHLLALLLSAASASIEGNSGNTVLHRQLGELLEVIRSIN